MQNKFSLHKVGWLRWFLPTLILSAVATLDLRSLVSPVIFSDDWCYLVSGRIFGGLTLVDWSSRRPFTLTLYTAVMSVAGLRLQYLILLNFLITFATAILLYFLLRRVLPQVDWLALPVTLVYLVYPVDTTRTWMVTIYIHLVLLITLGVLWLLVDFAARGGGWQIILAWAAILVSLGAYEGQFGLLMGGAVLLAVISRRMPAKRRALLLSILLTGALFIFWRVFVQPQWLNIHDTYFQEIQLSPVFLIYRFYLAASLFTVGWASSAAAYFGLSQGALIAVIGGVAVIAALLVYLLRAKREPLLSWGQREPLLKTLLLTFLTGVFFWGAGYIPGIAIFNPTGSGVASRGNVFAIPGASLALVSLVAYVTALAGRSRQQAAAMTLAAILPFVIVGGMAQLWIQSENDSGWNDQKQLWNGLFAALPGVQDGTTVVIVIPGYDHLRPLQRLPLTAQWEAACGMQVLNNQQGGLRARFYYPDLKLTQPTLLEAGVKEYDTDEIIPYANTIFVSYDPAVGSVRLIERLEDQFALPFQVKGYAPRQRITPQPPQAGVYRWLVR